MRLTPLSFVLKTPVNPFWTWKTIEHLNSLFDLQLIIIVFGRVTKKIRQGTCPQINVHVRQCQGVTLEWTSIPTKG